jgi:hypothetical protein
VSAASACEAGQDRCRAAPRAFPTNKEFFRFKTTRFISRSLTLLSIGTAPSEQKTFSSFIRRSRELSPAHHPTHASKSTFIPGQNGAGTSFVERHLPGGLRATDQ